MKQTRNLLKGLSGQWLVAGGQMGMVCFFFLMIATGPSIEAEEIVAESTFLSVLHSAEIPARDLGILEKLEVKEGQKVKAGAKLASLNQTEAQLELKLATGQLNVAREEADNEISQSLARKTIEVAQAELKRAQEANLKYPETVSLTEVDRLRLISEKAVLDYDQAVHEQRMRKLTADLKEIEQEIAQANLERRTIKSPLDGSIEKIYVRPGEWVQPGTTLLRVVDVSTLRAEAILPAEYRYLDLIQTRVSVEVKTGESGEKSSIVEGKITFMHPEFDPIDGSFRLWAELDNTRELLSPGESVTMTIHLGEKMPADQP
ncbi:MAG TPA: hypothetical protein DD473_28205 [Planctomycetaceae bacterium]|nr:hypothetical protein [Planctomycetaceae bacterium]